MSEDLSTFARIRIAALSMIFAGLLTLFVTGVPELPRAVADDSGVPSPGAGECDGFCGSLKVVNACSTYKCCQEGELACDGVEQRTLALVRVLTDENANTCVKWGKKVLACESQMCVPSGHACAEKTCHADDENTWTSSRVEYYASGLCPPTQ